MTPESGWPKIHPNDKQNQIKHKKMWRRAKAGRIPMRSKWYRNSYKPVMEIA